MSRYIPLNVFSTLFCVVCVCVFLKCSVLGRAAFFLDDLDRLDIVLYVVLCVYVCVYVVAGRFKLSLNYMFLEKIGKAFFKTCSELGGSKVNI